MAEGLLPLLLALGLTITLVALGAALWRQHLQLQALRRDCLRAQIEIVEAARLQRAQQQLEQAQQMFPCLAILNPRCCPQQQQGVPRIEGHRVIGIELFVRCR